VIHTFDQRRLSVYVMNATLVPTEVVVLFAVLQVSFRLLSIRVFVCIASVADHTLLLVGISDAYYCSECTRLEKDRDGCPKIVNLGASRTDLFYERRRLGASPLLSISTHN
jgi:hypothetical protein